jgi:tetratricopeptide (TPR) repeat protein
MKKIHLLSLVLSLLMNSAVNAQSLEEGKHFINYERFKSAREVLQKIVIADPQNEEAAYWLGQAILRNDESGPNDWEEAKKLYQSKLGNKENTLIMVGIGHIELLEGKVADARNHFEAAISLTQGKSIAVLNAIGFANGNPDSKTGDVQYAIDKLNQATQLKKFNDPDVWVNLGDAHRKQGDGGNALLAYQSALTLNSKYARANYRIGRMYQSQGRGQESVFMEYYNKAIESDPNFAPVYSTLFSYHYQTNVNLAADYFEKWLAHSDEDVKSCYYRASLKYAQGLFQEAVAKADECIAGNKENAYSKLYGIKALAYNKLNDSVHTIETPLPLNYIKTYCSSKKAPITLTFTTLPTITIVAKCWIPV